MGRKKSNQTREAIQSSQMLQLVLDTIPVRVFWKDINSNFLGCNRNFALDAGLNSAEEILGLDDFQLPWSEQAEAYRADDREVMQSGIPKTNYEEPQTTPAGDQIWLRTSKIPLADENGKVIGVLGTYEDITELKKNLIDMEHQATHDSLTDLPNREMLLTSIGNTIRDAEGTGRISALMLMDLDRFKEINDTLGHHSGDLLLKQIGLRLRQHLAENGALVTRLGGDEFAIFFRSVESEEHAIGYVKTVLAAIKDSFEIDGLQVAVGSSIGVSLYPEHGNNPSNLLRCADVAMYHAKQHATGYTVYSADHDEYSLRRLALMTDLGLAIREDQLLLHYQPKISVADNHVVGLEALVRWQHPDHGLVPPDQFIPMAETSELIKPLTSWVVDCALRQLADWQRSGLEVTVAVNVSTRNLLDGEFPDTLERLLREHSVDPALLELEITESAIVADPARTREILQRISAMGVRLAVDDFGTGYSSLAYLKGLPIHALKIDLSFVRNMTRSEQDRIIVESTINLAHSLNLAVVAEGVEHPETLEALKDLGCDHAQGFFVSRPLDNDGAEKWLQAWRHLVV
ncbi:MAG: EAL domain-containing protein [Gammaproteobacteria bacterium]|nr:EAL domain-containing protein [Gammaproteobacteria bacterium]